MVTEAYESNRLLSDLRRQNGMVRNHGFLSIHILLILPSVIINNKDLLKHRWFSTFIHKFLKTIGIIYYCWTLMLLLNKLFSLSQKMTYPCGNDFVLISQKSLLKHIILKLIKRTTLCKCMLKLLIFHSGIHLY